ncbi:C-C chemokine receptor type 10 isoform X1 [Perca fluviatilis]|uniref:C-C chemokine receptor type 10 isoform X1 n=1 Tax=Perca fluviatilis TaxID=8168 RepID=UPI0019631523|nr:C-C chemokine receptor type 10 isoform X1 [Perca fluviatilis]
MNDLLFLIFSPPAMANVTDDDYSGYGSWNLSDLWNTSNATNFSDLCSFSMANGSWILSDLCNTSNATNLSNLGSFCEAGEHGFTIKTFQSCVFCLIFLLGVVGNCLVIATFALYRRLRLRSMTDVFLLHLALADLLLILTLPLQAVDTHKGWIFPVLLCKATRASYAINTYSGLQLLACISVDRYMVVARAQEMLRLRRRILTVGKVAVVGVWLVAVLLSLPEILYSGVSGSNDDAYCGMQKSGTVKMSTSVAIVAVFCLSFFVMVTCYSLIARVLWEGNAQRRGKQWHRQRTLKLMVALVVVFLLFQLPYTVVLSRKMAGSFCALLLEYITCTLAYIRCCLNPILYAMVGVRFRNDVLRLVHDSGCRCGLRAAPQTLGTTSVSRSSPASKVVSFCSPLSPEPSCSSNETAPTKFQFPGTPHYNSRSRL